MQKSNFMHKYKIKKIDSITIVLSIFILFLISLSVYLYTINDNNTKLIMHAKTVDELKLLNKSFNKFLQQQSNFINYDKINQDILQFDKDMKFLTFKDFHGTFPLEYHKLTDALKHLYLLKIDSIERFKSINSQLLYALHDLYDLNAIILKSKNINKKSKDISNATTLYFMRYYINSTIDDSYIFKNLKYIQSNNPNNKLITSFSKHIKINFSQIKNFHKIKSSLNRDNLDIALNKLYRYLNHNYLDNLLQEKIIVTALFIITIIILFILIIMNRRSLSLRDQLLGFKVAIENSYNSIIITDLDSNITYVNDVAIYETGYSKEELIGQNPRVLKSGLQKESFYQELHDSLNAGKKWEGEFINKKKDGSLFYEKASIMPIYQNEKVVNYLAIKLNITDYVEEKHKVEYMAYHDSLTGLANRINIEEYLKNRLTIAKRNDSKIALLFIDLDRFKTINDTLGHNVGDELLIASAKRMKSALRDSDMIARIGGDEFTIVIESPNNSYSAAYICEKIIKLFNEPIEIKSHILNITLSIGVSIYPDDSSDDKQLFKYADIAMYQAKDAGKNTYRYYKKELSALAYEHLNMEQNLKDALKKSEFYMMYQPQYNIINRQVVSLEALIRWENNSLGNVPPDKFIPIAEETGSIIDIGLFVFEQSCIDFLNFKKISNSLESISINVSVVQLYEETFIDDIIKITKKLGIDTSLIRLEITETHIMKNISKATILLKRFKDLGFSISIDDFGTGHSSLSYLKLLPIDELKIDKSFVDDLPLDKNDVAISKTIITLSKTMGYLNVAEGIENKEQEDFLRENNCHIAQGYYFCRPKKKDDLINFLKEKNEKK